MQNATIHLEYKRRNILNMTEPDITVYPIIANPLSIIQNHPETREWILSSFIQLCFNGLALNFFDFNYKYCPYLNVQRISKEYIYHFADILEFIVCSISQGYYVYLLANRSSISAYGFEYSRLRKIAVGNIEEVPHDVLIYGYDLDENMFYIADNFVNGKYSFSKCKFIEMQKAVSGIAKNKETRLGFNGNIELLSYYSDTFWKYKFSIEYIHDSLVDYYTSTPVVLYDRMETRQEYGLFQWKFGMDCYSYIKELINSSTGINTHIQDFHLMWEHKKHLYDLTEYLLKRKYIRDDTLCSDMHVLGDDALVIRNLAIKNALSEKKSTISRIYDKCCAMEEKEKVIILQLIQELEECNGCTFWRTIDGNTQVKK